MRFSDSRWKGLRFLRLGALDAASLNILPIKPSAGGILEPTAHFQTRLSVHTARYCSTNSAFNWFFNSQLNTFPLGFLCEEHCLTHASDGLTSVQTLSSSPSKCFCLPSCGGYTVLESLQQQLCSLHVFFKIKLAQKRWLSARFLLTWALNFSKEHLIG